MADLKKYIELKRKVETAQQKADRAEGALQQVMKQLKSEFGCTTLDAAKKKLLLLTKQESKAKKEFDSAVKEFEEKWEDEIEE